MKVEVGKKYIRSGRPNEIWTCLCKIPHAAMPFVLACENRYLGILYVAEDGITYVGKEQLVEWSPYKDFKKDDPVMVSNDGETWFARHFSHVENQKPFTFYYGRTSWASKTFDKDVLTMSWNFCRRPTEEELNS